MVRLLLGRLPLAGLTGGPPAAEVARRYDQAMEQLKKSPAAALDQIAGEKPQSSP